MELGLKSPVFQEVGDGWQDGPSRDPGPRGSGRVERTSGRVPREEGTPGAPVPLSQVAGGLFPVRLSKSPRWT